MIAVPARPISPWLMTGPQEVRPSVVGTDFCREMLVIGQDKVRKSQAASRVVLVEGDTQRLPVPSDTFGVVVCRLRPAQRSRHDLRHRRDDSRGPAGRKGRHPRILASSRQGPGRLYFTFFRHILPRVGQAIAPNEDQAYHYLPRSVLSFPDGQDMLDLLGSRGLIELRCIRSPWASPRCMWEPNRASAAASTGGEPRDELRLRSPRPSRKPDLVVAMTGASGAPYAVGLAANPRPAGPDHPPDRQPQRGPGARAGTGPGAVAQTVRSPWSSATFRPAA